MPCRVLAVLTCCMLSALLSCAAVTPGSKTGPGSDIAATFSPGQTLSGSLTQAQAGPALAGLPALPSDRGACAQTSTIRLGRESEQRSPAASEQGDELLLDASLPGSSFQWAIYHFQPELEHSLLQLSVALGLQAGNSAWLAVGDYSQQRWVLLGTLGASANFELNDAQYLSAERNFFCAVLVPAGSVATVQTVELLLSAPDGPPEAVLSPWEISGTAPLLVRFNGGDSSAGGSDVQILDYAWDWEDDGSFDRAGPEAQQSHSFAVAGYYQVRLRISDSAGGMADDIAVVLVNAPPQAQIQFPAEIESGVETTLDGSGSSDADGQIVRYEWDTDGDGTFDADTAGVSSIAVTYPTGGDRTVMLRVTDDFGAQAMTAATLTVSGWSGGQTLESQNYCGQFSNLMLVEGRPAIAFHEATNHDVRFMRSMDSEGKNWGISLTVEANGFVGIDLSMAIVDGFPALSYQDADAGTLHYVRAQDALGSVWGSSRILDDQGYTGRTSSLAVVNGKPAISYSRLGGPLLFVRAVDNTGELWGSPVPLDNAGFFTVATSMAMVDGAPAVAYSVSDSLRFVRASDSDGTSWGVRTILANTSNGEGGCSMQIVSGNPAIAFNHIRGEALAFIRANDAQGSSWAQVQFLDSLGGLGTDCCLRLINGLPVVSYYEDDNGDLRFVMGLDASGSAWDEAQVLDSQGNTGRWSSMMDSGESPLISYFDESLGDLRLIRLVP